MHVATAFAATHSDSYASPDAAATSLAPLSDRETALRLVCCQLSRALFHQLQRLVRQRQQRACSRRKTGLVSLRSELLSCDLKCELMRLRKSCRGTFLILKRGVRALPQASVDESVALRSIFQEAAGLLQHLQGWVRVAKAQQGVRPRIQRQGFFGLRYIPRLERLHLVRVNVRRSAELTCSQAGSTVSAGCATRRQHALSASTHDHNPPWRRRTPP